MTEAVDRVAGLAVVRPADRAADRLADRLWEEIVYIAYHLHWSFDSILDLDHATRARVITEIGALNARLDGAVAED